MNNYKIIKKLENENTQQEIVDFIVKEVIHFQLNHFQNGTKKDNLFLCQRICVSKENKIIKSYEWRILEDNNYNLFIDLLDEICAKAYEEIITII